MTDTLVAESRPALTQAPGISRPFLPLLVVLFVGSGCAALIYEIVWLQKLGLVIGQSAISLGVLLGTFMGGMCIGSLLFPKIISRKWHPLLIYGLLEATIGLIGLFELPLIERATDLYTHFAVPGGGAVALRSVIAGICLLPPTILMGATLPAIARYVESSPRGVSWLGFFYGGNIVGAVIGCLTAGFYLLRVFDMQYAAKCAVAINFAVALLAIIFSLLAEYSPKAAAADAREESQTRKRASNWPIYVAIGLSGLTGLGAEVVWTRQLSLMLGATVYTFSNILAVFLLGLGIGSSVGAFIARSAKEPAVALSWCQLLLAGAVAWAAYAISFSLPFWPLEPGIATNPWFVFQANLAECFWAVLPGALLWGASFPIALAAIARRGQDPGKLVGGVYAANTVGAILGSLFFTLIVMQYSGSQNAQRILVAICALSGVIAMIPAFTRVGRRLTNELNGDGGSIAGLGAALVLAVVVAGWLVFSISEPNWGAVAWGRNSAQYMGGLYPATISTDEYYALKEARARGFNVLKLEKGALHAEQLGAMPMQTQKDNQDWLNSKSIPQPGSEAVTASSDGNRPTNRELITSALRKRESLTGTGNMDPYDTSRAPDRYCVYLGEGMNVSVAVTYDDAGYRYFHGAGKVQASSNPEDMRLQRTLGHISALMNWMQTKQAPKDVLVVACGAGVTAGSFVPYGSNITIVDIEPMVPKFVTPQFADVNYHVIPSSVAANHDPKGYDKTNVIIDDGRHYVRTVKQKFDVITSDPIDPWVKGCAALNTVEYYQMCKEHLKPGGIMALWIPLYESSEDTSKSVIATFFKVFPNGIIWSNDVNGQGYDAVLFGSVPAEGAKDDTLHIDVDAVQEYLEKPGNEDVRKSLQDVGFGSKTVPGSCEAVELLATYAGTAPRMTEWTQGTDNLINYDRNLRLQYVAGLGVNLYMAGPILNGMLAHYSFPDEIFKGSPERISALKELLSETGRHEK